MRWIPQALLTLLLLFTIPATIAGNWTKRQVFNTDVFVETVAPLASTPEVQDQAVAKIMTFIDEAVAGGIDGIDSRSLTFTANVAYDTQRPRIERIVQLVIQSNEFETAFVAISTGAHTIIVDLLQNGESELVKSSDGMVYLDLTPAFKLLADELKTLNIADFSGVTLDPNNPPRQLQIDLVESDGLAKAQRYADLLDQIALILIGATVVLMALYLVIAKNKGLGLFGLGIITLVAMALLRTGHFLGQEFLIGEIPDPNQQTLATDVYTIVLRSLLDWVQIGAAIGAVAVVAGFLWSRVRPASF